MTSISVVAPLSVPARLLGSSYGPSLPAGFFRLLPQVHRLQRRRSGELQSGWGSDRVRVPSNVQENTGMQIFHSE